MSEINDGGPAFVASPVPDPNDPYKALCGMSLRDWFATSANDTDISSVSDFTWDTDPPRQLSRSERRYVWADAMLAAREAKP